MMARAHSKRGSLVVAALLLFSLLLALGLGLMSSQSGRMRAAQAEIDGVRAKELALAAWADCKAKLGKDIFFPPSTDAQGHFSYSEDVYDADSSGNPVFYGTYSVVIDTRYSGYQRDGTNPLDASIDSLAQIPLGFYLVTCTGKVGLRGAPPSAERTLEMEVDARTLQVIRFHDLESL